MKEITFLGFLISEQDVSPEPKNTLSIQNFLVPKNARAIKSFMGMVNYYSHHIPNLSDWAKPLHNLLKKDTKFVWLPECDTSFQHLKNCLMSPPILRFPDFDQTFYITTDGSKLAVSAILQQKYSNELLPIAYASRTLNDAETRYPTAEIEVLAIVWGIRHFRTYVGHTYFEVFSDCKALKWLLQLKSNNSRLLRWKFELEGYDFKINNVKGKENVVADCLSRYTIDPQERVIDVITRSKANDSIGNATYVTPSDNMKTISSNKDSKVTTDYLPTCIVSHDTNLIQDFPSKLHILHFDEKDRIKEKGIDEETLRPGTVHHKPISNEFIVISSGSRIDSREAKELIQELTKVLVRSQVNNVHMVREDFRGSLSEYTMVTECLKENFSQNKVKRLLLDLKPILVTDENDRLQLLKDFHDAPLAGHQGIKRMAHKLSLKYKWPNIRKDIRLYVQNCQVCQRTKPKGIHKHPMQVTTESKTQFSKIHMDCVGPLVESTLGFKYIFTFQDELPRYFGEIPITEHTALTVAKSFTENVILKFGIPEVIMSDLGSEFVNEVLTKVSKMLGIRHHKTTAYHPQSNGILERSHSILKSIIRADVQSTLKDWHEYMPYAVFVINSSVNRSTGYTPHELVFAYKLSLPSNLKKKPDPVYNYEDYYTELKYKLQTAHHLARQNSLSAKMIKKSITIVTHEAVITL